MSDAFAVALIGLIMASIGFGFIMSSIPITFVCLGMGLIVMAFVMCLLQDN